jgi:hypothetical protein
LLKDAAISGDRNVFKKKDGKILKYKKTLQQKDDECGI